MLRNSEIFLRFENECFLYSELSGIIQSSEDIDLVATCKVAKRILIRSGLLFNIRVGFLSSSIIARLRPH